MAVDKGVNFRIRATNETGPAIRGVAAGLRTVNREIYTGAPLMKSWNAGLNSNRRAIQQLGFQVGDFATQIAGGQSAMLAFTQQGGQMLQFFGPFGAVMAALLAVFGSLTIALHRSGASLTALAPALMLTSDQIRMIADAWHWLGQSLLTVANLIVNHLSAIMGAAAAVGAYFAIKWVASMVAATLASNTFRAMLLSVAISYHTAGAGAAVATLATNIFTGALVALRAVLVSLGIGALIVLLGLAVEAMMRIAKATGGLGNGFRLLGDLAVAAWDYIVTQAGTVPDRLRIVWNNIAIGFIGMVNSLRLAWYKFLVSIGQSALSAGWDDVAAKIGGAAEAVGGAIDAGESSIAAYGEANTKLSRSIASETGAAADAVTDAWGRVKQAWIDGGSAIDLGDMFGGAGADGAGGGGGAANKIKEQADEIKKIFEDMQSTIADSISSSFKGLLKGTKSVSEALLDILGSILDKIIDIVAQPIFNSIAGSMSGMILGSLGLPSFEGGTGHTFSGPRAGGVDGRGGRLAVLHSDEAVIDKRGGGGSGGTVINMTVNTPDAASFRASRRQIEQQLRGAVK